MSATSEANPVSRVYGSNSKSLRDRIDAMCAHCMGCTHDPREPGFLQAVRGCTAPDCPLYPVRPYQKTEIKIDGKRTLVPWDSDEAKKYHEALQKQHREVSDEN